MVYIQTYLIGHLRIYKNLLHIFYVIDIFYSHYADEKIEINRD